MVILVTNELLLEKSFIISQIIPPRIHETKGTNNIEGSRIIQSKNRIIKIAVNI